MKAIAVIVKVSVEEESLVHVVSTSSLTYNNICLNSWRILRSYAYSADTRIS